MRLLATIITVTLTFIWVGSLRSEARTSDQPNFLVKSHNIGQTCPRYLRCGTGVDLSKYVPPWEKDPSCGVDYEIFDNGVFKAFGKKIGMVSMSDISALRAVLTELKLIPLLRPITEAELKFCRAGNLMPRVEYTINLGQESLTVDSCDTQTEAEAEPFRTLIKIAQSLRTELTQAYTLEQMRVEQVQLQLERAERDGRD